jgi:hypothetical protein
MTAHIGGTLHVDLDTGCVLIDGHPVVWPADTTLRGEPAELRLPGEQAARSGDTVSGGGGLVPSTVLRTTRLRIRGDLARAVRCAVKSDASSSRPVVRTSSSPRKIDPPQARGRPLCERRVSLRVAEAITIPDGTVIGRHHDRPQHPECSSCLAAALACASARKASSSRGRGPAPRGTAHIPPLSAWCSPYAP